MSWNNKVIWTEGMFLQPQHFQLQDRYFEGFIKNWAAPLYPYSWGFSTIEINTTLLKQGKIQLTKGSGIFPDGTPFDFPSQNDPPLPLDIDPNLRDEDIVLALPLQGIQTTEMATSGSPDNQLARYLEDEIKIPDCTTTINNEVTGIKIGRLNLKLMCKRDAANAYTTLGVARIKERSINEVILEEKFIPPMLNVASNEILTRYLQELCGLLTQRGNDLAAFYAQPGDRGSAGIADFLMLQTINRHELLFSHLNTLSILHPEKLYSICLNLVGDLAIFNDSNSHRPNFQPAYQHDALWVCFDKIMVKIRELLASCVDSKVTLIKLEKDQFSVWHAVIHNKALFRNANFILAIKTQYPAETIRERFPSHIKIGPHDKIRNIVNNALTGIPLIPLSFDARRIPIPIHTGFTYFEFGRENELWNELEHSAGLAFFIAGNFPELELELWTVEE